MRIKNGYVFFWGENDVLSNFYPVAFRYKGLPMHSSEQAYMLEKAWFFEDTESADLLLKCTSPGMAKGLGRKVKGYDDTRWSEVRYAKMVEVLRAKFSADYPLEFLIATDKRILVESSPTDTIWGVGLSEATPLVLNPANWKGQNLLGKALMQVRDEIKEH